MEMPKPSAEAIALFRSVVLAGPDAEEKKMFGQLAGFVHGNMFCGLFGDQVNVRLSPADREAALKAGAMPFEPMGRPMKEYVVLAPEAIADPDTLAAWVGRAYRYAADDLPPKLPKEPKPRAPRKG